MEKTLGNFLSQQNNDFPLDCETLDCLQNNIHMAELLGSIAGDKVILRGCDVEGSVRNPGYVFLRTADFPDGEVLHFAGGDAAHTSLYLDKTAVSVSPNAEPYPDAYTIRELKPGLGSEQYSWDDFAFLNDKTNRELSVEIATLRAQLAAVKPAPVGSIEIWPSNTIPQGWALCNGSSLSRTDYAELYAVLGTTFGSDDDSTFKLPDMMGRFVAGRGANGYADLNQKGGANTVALSVRELPEHTHSFYGDNDLASAGQQVLEENVYAKDWSTTGGTHTHLYATGKTGGNVAHENRPPYIVMNYIIKTI